MTTTVTVTAHAAKSSNGEQLSCMVTVNRPKGESSTTHVPNGLTSHFAAYEGVTVTVSEVVLPEDRKE